jgi:hypothetical protein
MAQSEKIRSYEATERQKRGKKKLYGLDTMPVRQYAMVYDRR